MFWCRPSGTRTPTHTHTHKHTRTHTHMHTPALKLLHVSENVQIFLLCATWQDNRFPPPISLGLGGVYSFVMCMFLWGWRGFSCSILVCMQDPPVCMAVRTASCWTIFPQKFGLKWFVFLRVFPTHVESVLCRFGEEMKFACKKSSELNFHWRPSFSVNDVCKSYNNDMFDWHCPIVSHKFVSIVWRFLKQTLMDNMYGSGQVDRWHAQHEFHLIKWLNYGNQDPVFSSLVCPLFPAPFPTYFSDLHPSPSFPQSFPCHCPFNCSALLSGFRVSCQTKSVHNNLVDDTQTNVFFGVIWQKFAYTTCKTSRFVCQSILKANMRTSYQEKASAEIRGEFFRPNSQVNFAVDFLVDFSGLFPWKKQEAKIHPKNPRQFSNQNLGVSGQNPHCKDPALTSYVARSDFCGCSM